jgi:hypothetical protein
MVSRYYALALPCFLLREEDVRGEQRTGDLVVEKLQTEFDTPLKGSDSKTASFF